jgi:hypothetical protein
MNASGGSDVLSIQIKGGVNNAVKMLFYRFFRHPRRNILADMLVQDDHL